MIQLAARGGVGAVLLREFERSDEQLAKLCDGLRPLRRQGLRVLMSRRLDLACALGLDGVQLTADSIPIGEAREWLAARVPAMARAWIGYSAHSRDEARAAASAGADYVTLSPIFATDSKPGAAPRGLAWLADAIRDLPIPALALGGLTPELGRSVLEAGAWGIAAASGIGAAPDVEAAARAFHQSIGEYASCSIAH